MFHTIGIDNAQSAPPSLQLICSAIFSVMLFNLSAREIVRDIITWEGIGISTQHTLNIE